MSSVPPRRVGFDVIADMIRDISLGATPVSPTLVGAVTAAGRNVKSSFTATTGRKRKPDDSSTPLSTTPSTKRRATVTPASLPSPTAVDRSSTGDPFETTLDGAMLIDRDVVPSHGVSRALVTQPFYRRLLPADSVRLMAGNEIIVVIPACGKVARRVSEADSCRLQYQKLFQNLMYHTLRGVHPGDRTSVVDAAIRERHTLIRGGKPYLEFACRVRHYAECEQFERCVTSLSAVKYSWSQGAGINLSVCGYSTQRTVMLEFKHDVGYLKVYRRVQPEDVFVNEGIAFSTNARDVNALLSDWNHGVALEVLPCPRTVAPEERNTSALA